MNRSTMVPIDRRVPKMRWFQVGIPEGDPRVMGHLTGLEHGLGKRRNLMDALRHSDTSASLEIWRIG
jgi:hypothetical protein